MKAFVYSDYSQSVGNYKLGKFALVTVLCVCFAEGVLEADKAFEAATGKNPIKNTLIGCAPMSLETFTKQYANLINEKSIKIVSLQKEIKQLNYIIYGLEHPWLKPQPEYII